MKNDEFVVLYAKLELASSFAEFQSVLACACALTKHQAQRIDNLAYRRFDAMLCSVRFWRSARMFYWIVPVY